MDFWTVLIILVIALFATIGVTNLLKVVGRK
jgi:hypothetical protein